MTRSQFWVWRLLQSGWKRPRPLGIFILFQVAALGILVLQGPLFMDEAFVLRGAAHLIRERSLNPPWHEWPPLAAYLGVLSIGLSSLMGSLVTGLGPRDWAAIAAGFLDTSLVLPLRLLSLLSLGVLAWAVGNMAARASRHYALGFVSVPVMIFGSPTLIQYAGWGLPDLPMAAFGALALWGSAGGYGRMRPDREAMLTGLLVGLAAGCKFHGGLMLLSVLALLAVRHGNQWLKLALRCIASALLGFIAVAPTFLFAPEEALGGLAWLVGNLAKDRYAPAELTAQIPAPAIWRSLHEAVALPLVAVWIVTVIVFRVRGNRLLSSVQVRQALAFGVTPAVTVVLVLLSQRRDGNYLIPAIPGMVVIGMMVMGTAMGPLRRWRANRVSRWLAGIAAVASFLSVLPIYLQQIGQSGQQMSRYLAENLPPDSVVLRVGGYTPKVWTPDRISEFLDGPGRSLSEKGRQEFWRRIAEAPRASSALVLGERTTTPTQVLDRLPVGAYILTTSLLRTRTRSMPRGNGGWGDFFDRLEDGKLFERVYSTKWSGAMNHQLYRRVSVGSSSRHSQLEMALLSGRN
jgi:hypothetical protein